jgi:hemerythrin superfamily protein
MTSEVDILTPIHKAVRAMIYEVATQIQTTDFTDPVATEAVVRNLRHEFASATATSCILCLLHGHAESEESFAFPEARKFNSDLVAQLKQQHAEILRRLETLSALADQLTPLSDPKERQTMGIRLTHEANRLFVFYLDHMNGEEGTLLPLLEEHLSDEELDGIRSRVERAMSPERWGEYMRWMLPALNASELADLLHDVQAYAPPEVAGRLADIGRAHVEPTRWAVAVARSGFQGASPGIA